MAYFRCWKTPAQLPTVMYVIVNFVFVFAVWCMAPLFVAYGNSVAGESCDTQDCVVDPEYVESSTIDRMEQTDSSLDARVRVHFSLISAQRLIRLLAPKDWRVKFDVLKVHLEQELTFHAETNRRRALNELLNKLGLQGIFYPGSKLIMITDPQDK